MKRPSTDKAFYTTGEYVGHFKPDSERNSFRGIYSEKRDYIVGQIDRIGGKNLRILDLGGGMGRITIPLASRHRMVLADLSLDMLRLAGEAGNGFHRLNCDAEAPCFAGQSFDAVIAVDLVSHLPNLPHVLQELRRILRPKGYLMIDVTNSNPFWILNYPSYVNPWRQPGRWIRTFLGAGVPPEWQGRIHHLSKRRFARMLRRSGFSVLDWAAFGPPWCPKWFLAVCRVE